MFKKGRVQSLLHNLPIVDLSQHEAAPIYLASTVNKAIEFSLFEAYDIKHETRK